MGIKNLNKFIRTNCKNSIRSIKINELNGKTIVVDISIYLYKYESENALLENMYLLLSIFHVYNVTPIFIFDGKSPEEKKTIINQRIKNRLNAAIEYKQLEFKLENSNSEDKQDIIHSMDKLKKQIVYITKDKIEKVKSLIRSYGATYYDAKREADELCAMLVIRNIAWACLSEDMDMFVYGCPRVIRYFSLINHTAILYCTESILQELQLSHFEFKQICVLSGTDYNIVSDSKEINLIDILNYFKNYKKSKEYNIESFYDWVKAQNCSFCIDIKLLDKINLMFDIQNSNLNDYENIPIMNGVINYEHLQNILQNDGFIFL